MGQLPTSTEPWLPPSGSMLVNENRLLRNKHDIPDGPKRVWLVQGPEPRACHLATEPFTNVVYAVHHVQAVQGSEQKRTGLGQGPKRGRGTEEAGMVTSLGNRHQASRSKEMT